MMRKTSLVLLLSTALLTTALASPALADGPCGDLIFRLTQGDYEQSFTGGETITLKPNRQGYIRAYYRSKGPIPHTLSGEYNHPSKYGFRGQDPVRVRQVIAMEPQKPNNIERARVVFKSGSAGLTTIGYRITGANDPKVLRRIPRACRAGILTVQVEGREPPRPVPQGPLDITGDYETEYGELKLQQEGDVVYGTFDEKRGHLIGTLDGRIFRGTWVQLPTFRGPNDAGDVELVFQRHGRRFNGAWRRGCEADWEGQWNGHRLRGSHSR